MKTNKFISFGSIGKFEDVVKNVQNTVRFDGLDEEGNAIYSEKPMPIIEVEGTEKIHGTNAAVCFNNVDGFWVQSRKNKITPVGDNAGCAFSAHAVKDNWMKIINTLIEENGIDSDTQTLSVFYEWAGGNIQKNSACSGLDKRAIIFKYAKVSPIDAESEEVSTWIETVTYGDSMEQSHDTEIWLDDPEVKIFNIMNYPTVKATIDFNHPKLAVNGLIELVEKIEEESLVGKLMGQEKNIGEGYVFQFMFDGGLQRFKVKGEAHSKSSKIRKLKPVDETKEKIKIEFVNDVACQAFRLDQMFTEIQNSKYNGNIRDMSKKDTGEFIRLVVNDVMKEELQEMAKRGLEPKECNGMISKVCVTYFQDRLLDSL